MRVAEKLKYLTTKVDGLTLILLLAGIMLGVSIQEVFGYPTTIAQGYKTCSTCHVTEQGGSLLNNYGRGMSEAFMSTWSTDGEAREFFISESDRFDIGADYRHLALNGETFTQFPMVNDYDGAVHLGNLTLAGSVGFYSRTREFETRESYARLRLFQGLSVRAGYFMPVMGIGYNDHSLAIKSIALLSRGNEKYNVELLFLNKWIKAFYTMSSDGFVLKNSADNFYRLNYLDSVAHRLRFSVIGIKGLELGINALNTEPDYQMAGMFVKQSSFKNQYFFFERNIQEDNTATYARLGYFAYQGVDAFLELDQLSTKFGTNRNMYIGVDWMIRPRIELGLKLTLGDGPSQYQTHLWW